MSIEKQTKVCSKCKEEKDVSNFHKNKNLRDGYGSWCKSCKSEDRLSRKKKRENNHIKIEEKVCSICSKLKSISDYHKDSSNVDGYRQDCKECSKKRRLIYTNKNKQEISEKAKIYYLENKNQILEKRTEYYNDNSEKILKAAKDHRESKALFDRFNDDLFKYEEIKYTGKEKYLQVKCTYCGKFFIPTVMEARMRVQAFRDNYTEGSECRFYCSQSCKISCPTYGQKLYPKGFKKATSREVTPLLRQLVMEREDYKCEICGCTSEERPLHVHHILSFTQNKMLSNDPDNCILVCDKHHKEIHQKEGCKYSQLKCKD